MTTADFVRTLRSFHRRRPFWPYLIELVSGDRLPVSHPEVIERSGQLFVYRSPSRQARVFAASAVCQVIDLPPPPAAAGTPPGTPPASPP
jgi:hypothetical protein